MAKVASLKTVFDCCIGFWPKLLRVLQLGNAADREKDVLIHNTLPIMLNIFAIGIHVAWLLFDLLNHVLVTLLWIEANTLTERDTRCLTGAVAREWACMAAVVVWVKLMHRFTVLLIGVERLAADSLASMVDIYHAVLQRIRAP